MKVKRKYTIRMLLFFSVIAILIYTGMHTITPIVPSEIDSNRYFAMSLIADLKYYNLKFGWYPKKLSDLASIDDSAYSGHVKDSNFLEIHYKIEGLIDSDGNKWTLALHNKRDLPRVFFVADMDQNVEIIEVTELLVGNASQ